MFKMIFNMRSGPTREFIGHGYEIPDSASDGAWVGILDEDDDPIALVAVDDISTIEIEYVEETKEEEEKPRVTANSNMNFDYTINPFEYDPHPTPYSKF
jgi:hypothetical protein